MCQVVTLKMKVREKMRRKIFEKCDADDEVFEKYLYAIGASINRINQQMEEVDS